MARIIAADDSLIVQKSYLQMLELLGHEAVICTNGKLALEAFRENPAELVILDVDMPEMDGFAACREIRKLPEGANIPIIMVSVEDSEENILNGMNAGANDYLIKPVKEQHLIAKLKNFLKYATVHKTDLDLVRNHVEIAGRYEIEKLLGYGAHSVVFLGNDKEDGKRVAIKLITPPDIEDFPKNFDESAAKLKSLSSPNIIRVFDYGRMSDKFYLVMEFADGGDLSGIFKKKKLAETEAVTLALEAVKGLKVLAANGIIHLDIKPENIMICGKDYKLSDFGILSPRATGTVPIMLEIWGGTAYLPPEYLDETGFVDCRSDIYSLGITLYQAITGDNPFKSDKPAISMSRQLSLVPPPLRSCGKKVSQYFSELVQQMLMKNPAERPSLDEIEHILVHIREYLALPHDTSAEESAPHNELKQKLDSLISKPKAEVQHGHAEKAPPKKLSSSISGRRAWMAAACLIGFGVIAAIIAAAYSYLSAMGIEAKQPKEWKHMICAKCCVPEAIPPEGIGNQKCPECDSRMYNCDRCRNCGLEFAHPTIVIETGTIFKTKAPVTCPRCASPDVSGY